MQTFFSPSSILVFAQLQPLFSSLVTVNVYSLALRSTCNTVERQTNSTRQLWRHCGHSYQSLPRSLYVFLSVSSAINVAVTSVGSKTDAIEVLYVPRRHSCFDFRFHQSSYSSRNGPRRKLESAHYTTISLARTRRDPPSRPTAPYPLTSSLASASLSPSPTFT